MDKYLSNSRNYFSSQTDTDTKETIDETVVRLLKTKGEKALVRLQELLPKEFFQTHESKFKRYYQYQAEEEEIEYATIVRNECGKIIYNIIGCPLSTDIDLVICSSCREHLSLPIDPLVMIELTNDLKINLNHLPNKLNKLDINLIFIHPLTNQIVQTQKGGAKETQNIIFSTYHHHEQKFSCLVKNLEELEISDKLSAICKFVLDRLSILLSQDAYNKLRKEKIDIYKGDKLRYPYIIKILQNPGLMIFKNDDIAWRSAMKSLVMKLIQLIQLWNDEPISYTKLELSQSECLNGDNENDNKKMAFMFLTRQCLSLEQFQMAIPFLNFLYQTLGDIMQHTQNELNWIVVTPNELLKDIKIKAKIDDTIDHNSMKQLINLFLESPSIPSLEFIKLFTKMSIVHDTDGTTKHSINSVFLIPSHNLKYLPLENRNQVIDIPQRSAEWLKLLNFYNCGKTPIECSIISELKAKQNPNRADDDWIKENFHIISGAIWEYIVINYLDIPRYLFAKQEQQFESKYEYEKVTVGYLVQKIGDEKSAGVAPDLLLVKNVKNTLNIDNENKENNDKVENDDDEIISVEIKLLHGHPEVENKNYRRAIKLAKSQNTRCRDILKSPGRNLLCFGYLYLNELYLKLSLY